MHLKLGMQFKYPEILWALLLLLIPILIHLFQLRRFKKTPFTNVAMLQMVVSESRKSNTLKKWLLLLTRMMLLATLIIAFAQPFISSETALREKETVIYFDNSFSMQSKVNGLSLLEKSTQDLIKQIDERAVFSLFTNTRTFRNVTINDIKNDLLSLNYTPKQLQLDDIQLKAKTLFSVSESTLKNLILVSDFQQRMGKSGVMLDSSTINYAVPTLPKEPANIAIDSLYLEGFQKEQLQLTVLLSGGQSGDTMPISLYNGDTLIAKTSAGFGNGHTAEVVFSIQGNQEIDGRLQIDDNGLKYDNLFFFNVNQKERVKVLAISSSEGDYLERLYREDEFVFTKYRLNTLNYSNLDNQNVIILDHLPSIPNSLLQPLITFKENGGTLIVIPSSSSNLDSYNQFLSAFSGTRFEAKMVQNKKVTTISFDHPLYENVFEKEVSNFQYPELKQYFTVDSQAPAILSLDGGDAFLLGINGFYLFSASLEQENSNFKSSPLIVPTFYNMAVFSMKNPRLYHTLGKRNAIDISVKLGGDSSINISKDDYNFIPLQQVFPNKVNIQFSEHPIVDGIYRITSGQEYFQNISFNYPREESKLDYLNVENIGNAVVEDSIVSLFQSLEAENSITAYWKWFVILALLLLLMEVIIQKFVI